MKKISTWLRETVRVDIYGRELNVSSALMMTTTRRNAMMYRGYTGEEIYKMWRAATNG